MGSKPRGRQTALTDFFQALANAFLQGDHVWLAGIYTYPLVVYIEGEIFVERTPEETLANLFERREAALLAGTKIIRSTVQDVGAETNGRFPVRVNWEFLSEDGRELTVNELRYFCRFDPDGQTRIEILEFIKRGFPSRSGGVQGQVH